jgi:hypothetical protein
MAVAIRSSATDPHAVVALLLVAVTVTLLAPAASPPAIDPTLLADVLNRDAPL